MLLNDQTSQFGWWFNNIVRPDLLSPKDFIKVSLLCCCCFPLTHVFEFLNSLFAKTFIFPTEQVPLEPAQLMASMNLVTAKEKRVDTFIFRVQGSRIIVVLPVAIYHHSIGT